jgi:MFS family permease
MARIIERPAPSPSPVQTGFRSTLHNRYFLRLWMAQLISQTVQNSINYGSLVLLTQSRSFTAVGGVIIAFSLPAVIFGIPAGVLVDRFDKRTVLWVSNALRALVSFGFVLTLLFLPQTYWLIYLLTFLISVIGQFFGPAEGSAIPLLVQKGELLPALSLFNVTFSISQALGFVIVGPLIILGLPTITIMGIAFTSIHSLFLFIGVMYLVCTLLTWAIPAPMLRAKPLPGAPKRVATVWHGVVEAWNYVRKRTSLLIGVIQLTLGSLVITAISMIAPLFSQEYLNRPPALAAIVFIPAGLGLVLGSVLMPRIISRVGLLRAEEFGVIGVGSGILALIFTHKVLTLMQLNPANTPFYLLVDILFIFFIGLSLDLITLPAQTAVQHNSQDYIKGRVLAFQMMAANGATIPMILIMGPVADVLGLGKAMFVLAVAVLGLGLGSVQWSKHAMLVAEGGNPSFLNDEGGFKGAHSNPLTQSIANGAPLTVTPPPPHKETPRQRPSR